MIEVCTEKKMLVAYVAGPYRNSPEGKKMAKRVAKYLWGLGYAVICPHTNSLDFEHDVPGDDRYLEGYIEILKRCDEMFIVPGWQQSEGTLAEIAVAQGLGMPMWLVGIKGDNIDLVKAPRKLL